MHDSLYRSLRTDAGSGVVVMHPRSAPVDR